MPKAYYQIVECQNGRFDLVKAGMIVMKMESFHMVISYLSRIKGYTGDVDIISGGLWTTGKIQCA